MAGYERDVTLSVSIMPAQKMSAAVPSHRVMRRKHWLTFILDKK